MNEDWDYERLKRFYLAKPVNPDHPDADYFMSWLACQPTDFDERCDEWERGA